MERELLTVPQACAVLNLGKTQIYRRMSLGELRAVKCGKKTLIPRTAINDFIGQLKPFKDDGGE